MTGGRLPPALNRCWRSRNKTKEKEAFPGFTPCKVRFPPAPGSPGSPWCTVPDPLLQHELCSWLSAAVSGQHGHILTNSSPERLLSASALANWARQQLQAVPFPHSAGVHRHPPAPAEREGGPVGNPQQENDALLQARWFRCRAWNETVSEVWGAWASDDDALHCILIKNTSDAPSWRLITPQAFLRRAVGFSTLPAARQGLGLPKANA